MGAYGAGRFTVRTTEEVTRERVVALEADVRRLKVQLMQVTVRLQELDVVVDGGHTARSFSSVSSSDSASSLPGDGRK